jgi:hypothetical protein
MQFEHKTSSFLIINTHCGKPFLPTLTHVLSAERQLHYVPSSGCLFDQFLSHRLTLISAVDCPNQHHPLFRTSIDQLCSFRGKGQERTHLRPNCQGDRQGRGLACCCLLRPSKHEYVPRHSINAHFCSLRPNSPKMS